MFIGDPLTACPWCGKQFQIYRSDDEPDKVKVICPNSYCVVVPSGVFFSEEDAIAAIKDRVKG